MSLLSKNFIFRRENKDGQILDYCDSDVWSPNNLTYKWNEITVMLPAGGYYGTTNGMHTLSFTLRNFVGRIFVQATLASNPTDGDWFFINFSQCGDRYLEFNSKAMNTANRDTIERYIGATGTFQETVIGNFTYLRVGISRDYISKEPTEEQKRIAGKIEEVLINF